MAKSAKSKSAGKVSSSRTSTSKDTGIKYTDKSAGQPELIPIFEAIRDMLLPYQKGQLKLRGGENGQVLLVGEKKLVIDGRKKDEMWFAAALIQKGYVGFYFMPIYTNKKLHDVFKPELLKCLKGKACFHIRTYDKLILSQIKDALKIGYDTYKELGWI
mgnify:CR=1 FL=1